MLDRSSARSRFGRAAGLFLIAAATVTLAPLRIEAHDPSHAKGNAKDDPSFSEFAKLKPIDVPPHLSIERFAYLLVANDGKSSNGAMRMSDGDDARAAQRRLGGEVWWFRIDQSRYAMNDGGLMERVRALYRDQDARWAEQLGDIDETHAKLNAQIEELGRRASKAEGEKRRIESARDAVLESLGDADRASRESNPQLQQLYKSMSELKATYDELYREREKLHKMLKENYHRREVAYRDVEEQDLVFKQHLYDIAREAVRTGEALVY